MQTEQKNAPIFEILPNALYSRAALASAEALRESPEEAGPAMAAPQNAGGRRAAQSQASADQIRTAFGIGPGRRTA